ncbi:hypothetical protein H4R20_007321, partial [Coemansia guatemalensis]
RRRRISDAADTRAKPGIRKRTAVVGEAARPLSPPLPTTGPGPESPAAVRRTQAIGLSGMRVPKKRTAKPTVDVLDSHARRIRGEKRRVTEHAVTGRDEDVPSPAKRPRAAASSAARKADGRQYSSLSPTSASSSAASQSPPRTQARSQKTPAANVQPVPQSASATTGREAFIRERERQRALGSSRESSGKPTQRDPGGRSASRSTKTPNTGALGILGKAGRNGVATAKAKAAAIEDPDDLANEPPRRRIADISVPKISQRNAPASGMASSVAPAPASGKAPPMETKHRDDDVDNPAPRDAATMAVGLALSPALSRKMERISEKAALLNERS